MRKQQVSAAARGTTGLCAALLASVLSSGCGDTSPPTLQSGVLAVCANTSFEPVLYKKDDKLVGYDVDFLSEFASLNDLQLVYAEYPFNEIWLRPGRDECDLAAAGISDFASRHSAGVTWSKPYYTVLRTLLIRKADAATLKAIGDFSGKTIGFIQGSSAQMDVEARAPNDAILKSYGDAAVGIEDLKKGLINAFAEGSVSSDYIAKLDADLVVIDAHPLDPPDVLAYPTREASGLIGILNGYIDDNISNYAK